jgi:hypothetical protein
LPTLQMRKFSRLASAVLWCAHEAAYHHSLERHETVARVKSEKQEPIGIIISGGSREEPVPRFSRYVWGPAPEPAPRATTKAA